MSNERNTGDPRYEAWLTPSKKFVFHKVIKSIELIMSLPRIMLKVGKRIIGLQFLVWIVDSLNYGLELYFFPVIKEGILFQHWFK